jgi:tetratricopeptide (TPR) repeat protein
VIRWAVFFRRPLFGDPFLDVAPAHQALAEGRVEAAVTLLEGATRRQRRRASQAQIKLYLAATYALYGPEGLEWGAQKLREAAEADGEVAGLPLYRALYWEFAAYRGDAASDVRKGALAAARSGDAFAVYHAASALFAIRAYRRATRLLNKIDPLTLPDYLHWRYWSLLGKSFDASDQLEEAVDAFERAVQLAHDGEKHRERLNLAASLLELHRPERALRVLRGVATEVLEPDEQLLQIYLRGRAQLLAGNPGLALEHLQRASALEDEKGQPSYAYKLALAQCYGALGRFPQAISGYLQAIELAPKKQRTWTLHECALLLVEADRLPSARDLLLEVLRAEGYGYRAEVYADLAEVEYKLANLSEAAEHAQRALDLGAVVSACLTLGSVAYEYYHLDEAVSWFEKAAAATREGETDWLHAQEMLADIFVQQGYVRPERVVFHAEAALKYLHPSDEWALILQGYAARARELLGGFSRRFN